MCDPLYVGDVLPMLDRPVYTYREVDRLLGLNQDTARRWINGYQRSGRSYAPIVREQPLRTRWVTWGEFIETRLLSEYRDLDQIKIGKMRAVIAQLRERYDRRYPLAYSRPFVRALDREVIARAQEESGLEDEFWFVVRTDQYLMTPRTQRFFDANTYGPDPDINGDDALVTATRIDPRYPDVVLDPERRSGRPTVAGHNISIVTLAGMVLGGDPVAKIAEWYELTEDQVQQAVDFTVVHNLAA